MMRGPEHAPRAAAMLTIDCTTVSTLVIVLPDIVKSEDLLGLHFLGKISLGTLYARAVEEKPNPIRICATMSRYMLCEPGATADPMNDITQPTTRISFRAWKVSDADEMTGARTA